MEWQAIAILGILAAVFWMVAAIIVAVMYDRSLRAVARLERRVSGRRPSPLNVHAVAL